MWPFTRSINATPAGSTRRKNEGESSAGKEGKTHIAQDLILRSDLFASLPPAIFFGDVPQETKDEYLVHGGSSFILPPASSNSTNSRSAFGIKIVQLPINTACLVFTWPDEGALLMDKRNFPLVRYSSTWIRDCVFDKRLFDLRNYVVPHNFPSLNPSPPAIYTPLSSGNMSRKRKSYDTPIEALGFRYTALAKKVRRHQDSLQSRSHMSPPHEQPSSTKVYIGDAIITLSALYPKLSRVQVVGGNGWRLIPSGTLPSRTPHMTPSSTRKEHSREIKPKPDQPDHHSVPRRSPRIKNKRQIASE